ncbi:G2/mitotic-specific cyclin-A-like [Hydractinia symbiolongicarpus]|uniref:G2/mitotic-specific cyclin-A-like n=1 Tax=Hydractinia symbiolongicarpus TaxID=13093 RepID=UPI00254FD3A8|nr:G2/mitotic-specific cyclin-A-like [Hydractinia symbiolongicarpus]
MSIQIYQDAENVLPGLQNGKKNKREDSRLTRQHVPKPSKRTALGTINTNVQGCRVQPSRAVKEKYKTTTHIQKTQGKNLQHLKIHEDVKPPIKEPVAPFNEALSLTKDSPMILSPIPSDSFEELKSDEINSASVNDIDLEADATFGLPEYAQDIHNYLKKAEKKHRPKQHYIKKQADINVNMRAILIDWLVEVAEEYKLVPQTLYLTVNFIDRFLSCMSVLRGKLQLVGAACMLVAAKFEEIYPPEVAEFVYITDDTYTPKQVLRMEHLILKTLAFELSVPTAKNFLGRYLLAAGAKSESQMQYLGEYLCELSLIDYDISLKYMPSVIAASSVCVANYTLNTECWTPTLEFYSGYQLQDLHSCIVDLHNLFRAAPKSQQQAVLQKYKSPKFGCVSQLVPAANPLV